RDSVPLLGDIPVLGRLFRRDGKDNERRELVVFITPRILAVR
ncbi:TPA: DNA transporter HofQ, partial [Escherichia coli]|nr:DNA transporter HofQ [Escherichia coli]